MIVKCQLSIETTESRPQLLFYNRKRDWLLMCDATPEWTDRFGEEVQPRFFAEVRWSHRVQPPEFVRKLPEQGW